MGRNVVPFMLGEVGVSDRLTYTKLKSKLWIEKGCGNVCSLFFSPHRTGQIECCIKAGIGFCCQKECNRVEDYRIRLGGDNETAKTGGPADCYENANYPHRTCSLLVYVF